MWHIADLNKTIVNPISFTDKNGITHPSSIFTLWSTKELKRIGVTKIYGEDEKSHYLLKIKTEIKSKAKELIELTFPSFKQQNFVLNSTIAMIEFGTDLSEWPKEEFKRYEDNLIQASKINRIRKISNLVEAKFDSLPFDEAVLFDINKTWEEIDDSTS